MDTETLTSSLPVNISSTGQPMGFLDFIDESELPESTRKLFEDALQEHQKQDKEKKEYLYASNVEELPKDILNEIQTSGLDITTTYSEKEFDILLNVIKFCLEVSIRRPKVNEQPKLSLPQVDSTAPSDMLVETNMSLINAVNLEKVFKHEQFAGKGGYGRVFFARENKLPVAIKKMKHDTEGEIIDNLSEISFLRECNHPNIVKFLSAYRIQKEIWVVMEFMEGGTLSEAVGIYQLQEKHIAYVANEVLQAISYLHKKNWAHRDLKSSNIMMTIKGDVKLIDFGLCADVSNGPRHMIGSVYWMPPEMVQGQAHGCEADIWSFGVCLLEMLNVVPPEKDSKVKYLYTVATLGLSSFIEESKASKELKDLLHSCLKLNPSERATASTLLQHPFLKGKDTRKGMQSVLRAIFVSKSISTELA